MFLSFCVLDDFLCFSKKLGFEVFLVHSPMASVLLSASVERCFVSRMRHFSLLDPFSPAIFDNPLRVWIWEPAALTELSKELACHLLGVSPCHLCSCSTGAYMEGKTHYFLEKLKITSGKSTLCGCFLWSFFPSLLFTSVFLLIQMILPLYFKHVWLCLDLVFVLLLAIWWFRFGALASEKDKNNSIQLVSWEV